MREGFDLLNCGLQNSKNEEISVALADHDRNDCRGTIWNYRI